MDTHSSGHVSNRSALQSRAHCPKQLVEGVGSAPQHTLAWQAPPGIFITWIRRIALVRMRMVSPKTLLQTAVSPCFFTAKWFCFCFFRNLNTPCSFPCCVMSCVLKPPGNGRCVRGTSGSGLQLHQLSQKKTLQRY